jgi:hypothetical protein
VQITGFPTVGEDPTTLFANNSWEKALYESMKDKFNTFRGIRGLDVTNISDDVVIFVTHILACKLQRKFRKDEVSSRVIVAIEKCTKGVHMNWATFLVKFFLIDCTESQEK